MGSGFKDFAAGDILTAADVDGYLMRQTVMTFADASARDSALSGVLDEGMCAYLEDVNAVTVYNGSAWVPVIDSDVLIVDTGTNRVGINKTGPTQALDVSGSINVSGGYLINGTQIGAWSTYTPTLTNWTANSLDFRYAVVKDICFVTFNADIATMGTAPTFSLPSGISSDTYIVATGQFLDIGTRWFDMLVLGSGPTDVSMWFKETAPGYVGFGTITATAPITWASGDLLRGQFFYRVV